MSKKNSNAILKNAFKKSKKIYEVYLNFQKKLDNLKIKKLGVAVSGGPDSLALAAFSKAYEQQRKVKFYYILVDHKIRKNSSKEAIEVKSLLKKHNIFLRILNNRILIKKNIQGQARKIRYEMISNFCKKNKTKMILTAHNLEDQVETFFIRLSRGSGLTGLSAMSPMTKFNRSIYIFRPFLDIKKKVLINVTKNIFGKYFKDPSNKNKIYLRSKVRSLKKPLENSGIVYDQIIKSINNLASSKATLDSYYLKTSKEIISKTKKNVLINFDKFMSQNNEIKIKIINESIKTLKNNYYTIRSKKVLNLIENFKNENFKKSTLGGCLFEKKMGFLMLKTEKR